MARGSSLAARVPSALCAPSSPRLCVRPRPAERSLQAMMSGIAYSPRRSAAKVPGAEGNVGLGAATDAPGPIAPVAAGPSCPSRVFANRTSVVHPPWHP